VNDLSPKQHAKRAAIFLILGMAFAIVPAAGMYYEPTRKMFWLWALLYLSTIPAVGWGSAHLAQSRGYSSSAGCGLSVVAYVVSGFLGTTSPHPLALGIGALFLVLLPTVVLLTLPNKIRRSNKRRHH